MPKSQNKLPAERRDEINIARLGIISIQSRVDTSVTRWKTAFEIDRRPYRVECVAPDGRPHGIDSDIVLAIQTLYVRAGCPDHGWVHTTAYELVDLAGLQKKGGSYQRIKESLVRLYTTSFFVSEGWYDKNNQRKWGTDTMRYIDRIKYLGKDEQTELPGLDQSSTLSIKLGEQLAESIRARFTHVLDGRLLHQLEQPPARALYRLLEAHRTTGGVRTLELIVNLDDWRHACGISSDRPEIIRRTLTPAHEELIAAGYLQEVLLEGRGKKQTLTYRFQNDNAPDPALVEMLIGAGFARGAATEMVKVHEDRIEPAVSYARHRKEAGYQVRSMTGLIVDILKNPDRYVLPSTQSVNTVALTEIARLHVEQAEEQAHKEFEAQQAQLKTLTPAEQYQEAKPALNLLLKKHLSKEELKLLEQACLSGRIQAAELKDQVTLATGRLTLNQFIQDLKASLNKSQND